MCLISCKYLKKTPSREQLGRAFFLTSLAAHAKLCPSRDKLKPAHQPATTTPTPLFPPPRNDPSSLFISHLILAFSPTSQRCQSNPSSYISIFFHNILQLTQKLLVCIPYFWVIVPSLFLFV